MCKLQDELKLTQNQDDYDHELMVCTSYYWTLVRIVVEGADKGHLLYNSGSRIIFMGQDHEIE